ncbi:cytochrome c3 family protein [Sulfurimonas sp.]|uniref:cytochrome c3 family protein n=1 Tax=Sulfurimonas sp. TaxID=2022749 RepID=UPI0025CC3552|nr:cytochrome c3 family protein [Sulfurimonas sp.]
MSFKFIYLFLLLFTTISGNAQEISSLILQPQDKTRYIGESSTFVINATLKEADYIVIEQSDITTTLEIKPQKDTYCKTINLNPGENTVFVTLYKDAKPIGKSSRVLYFLSELFEGVDEYELDEYKIRFFHQDAKEKKCASCHNMTSNIPTNNEALEDVTKTTCYECHNSMISTKNTHAPAANWLCINCHNGKFGEYNMQDKGASKYLVADPVAKTCAECHEDVKEWEESKFGHGPVNDGRCERCHNPHGSDNEFFLRKSIWELCTTCHAEKSNGQHVTSAIGFGAPNKSGGHPTRDREDPARPGRELTCSGCHNPHGSGGISLLRMKGTMPYGVCQRCHKK